MTDGTSTGCTLHSSFGIPEFVISPCLSLLKLPQPFSG